MKKEIFTMSIADANENNALLKLESTFGDKSVTFTIRDKDGKSCATTLAPVDLNKVVDFLNGRLNAVEESPSNYASYTPTGVGLCVFDYQGKLLDTYYNHESLAHGIEGYSYEQLAGAFGGDKAIYVLFTLYDGSVGRETLVRVMQACVQLQSRFIVTGEPTYCSPMTLDDVAQKAGLDLTTVSRCARENSKKEKKEAFEKEVGVRIYGPRKTFTLDNKVSTLDRPSLFDEGITRDGFPVSRLEVLDRIQAMINKENKHKPLGDQDITDELKSLGYDIERRTVAKYRGELLGLPNSNQRRQNN